METKPEAAPTKSGTEALSPAAGGKPAASAGQPVPAQEPSVAPALEPSKEATVEQAVRKIVQNEIRKGPPPAERGFKRSKWDFFWLLMLIASVGLTVTYIHGLLERPELKTLLELLPWLLAIFGLSSEDLSTWLRRHSQGGAFRTLLSLWFTVAVLLQVRFVPVYARVEPADAEFFVDGKLEKPGKLWLTLRGHKFEARPHEGLPGTPQTLEREWQDLLFSWNQPLPSLILGYRTAFACLTREVEFVIQRKNGLFETTYEPHSPLRKERTDNWDRRTVILTAAEGSNTGETDLPYGEYEVYVRKDKCSPSLKKPLLASLAPGKSQIDVLRFEHLQCQQP